MLIRKLVLASLLVVAAPGVTPTVDPTLQGFVSAGLLQRWCESDQPLDNEACLSYLRGAFDMLQVVRHVEHRRVVEDDDGGDAICVSALAPATQLKIAARRYARSYPSSGDMHAGLYVVRMLKDIFPC